MSFSEPYEESFESPEPLSEAQVEDYAMLFLKVTYPNVLNIELSPKEKEKITNFFKKAHPDHQEAVQVRMLYLQRFFQYINPEIPLEEKAVIQIEMDKIPALKNFIEHRHLATLVDAYIMWHDALRRAETDADMQGVLGEVELSPDDAYELFHLLEQHPDVVDERFKAASIIVDQGPYVNSPIHIQPNEDLYKSDHLKLLALKKSLQGEATPEGQAYLEQAFREDPYFKIIADKIASMSRG